MSKKVIIIGAGFGGLSSACYLAKAGYNVTVVEKNKAVGGRAMTLKKQGFTFDLGPSWYMMPDVFEEFFADFDKKPSDFYELVKLDPSYKVFTAENQYEVYDEPRVYALFEQLEQGSARQLKVLLEQTKLEYEAVRKNLLTSPMLSMFDVANQTAIKLLANPELLGSYHARIKKYVSHPDLQKILEFMVVFMGGSPKNIPALYTLLTYVDMGLGIWYPMGGMNQLVQAMYTLARSLGVEFMLDTPVDEIEVKLGSVSAIRSGKERYTCDILVANADYHHVETSLLPKPFASEHNWDRKVMSPSGLLVYLGLNKKLKNIHHHNLFFDVDWDKHFNEVFKQKKWSNEPMLYVGAPSVTDPTVAPQGQENIFILAPMANGAEPNPKQVQRTVKAIVARLEYILGESIADSVVVSEIKAHNYFINTFNAYKGNAFGLAHTLKQSAFLRPRMKHKFVDNLYFVGQYTNPGTGVPIVTLGGKVVSTLIKKNDKH